MQTFLNKQAGLPFMVMTELVHPALLCHLEERCLSQTFLKMYKNVLSTNGFR